MLCLMCTTEKPIKKKAKFSTVESIYKNNLKEPVFLTGQSIKN